MTSDIQQSVFDRIDMHLKALLAIAIEDLLRRNPGLAEPRPRSIDKVLHDAGLPQGEIAALLGKTPQAVSQQLAKKAAAKKSSARKRS